MQRVPRTVRSVVVLTTFLLLATPALALGPAGTPVERAGSSGVPWLGWLHGVAVHLGLLAPASPEDAPEPRAERRAGSSGGSEPELTTSDGSTCEPGSTERDCSFDPDG